MCQPRRPDRSQAGQKQSAQYDFSEKAHEVLLQQICSRDWLQAGYSRFTPSM
jgi:hypothetical protein